MFELLMAGANNMAGKKLRIGLVGYGFMGRTHSNAFHQAQRFFDLDYTPELVAVCEIGRASCRERV